ncbi:cyclic nucleotide-binding domain-containing protein [Desulfitobacterium sp. AusDCA]|uniref:cyclic nucleotide-binding domain-containing protein n=1 Tax=Desulfitobacterium sp. AusDCA TaxID=3240383 RepID=UPI003DA6D148
MNTEKAYYLAKVPFFADLTPQEIEEIAVDFQWETYPKGELILEQGQKPASFYVLCEGLVEVQNKNGERSPASVKTVGSGSVFGELSVLMGKPFQETLLCMEKCRVLSITAADFARILLERPLIYLSIIGQLSETLDEANQLLSETKYREVLRSAIKLTQYQDKFYGIWGSVKTTKEVERKYEEIQHHPGHLLIKGERGTGRQMIAWYLHKNLFGEIAPFVLVDGLRFDHQWGSLKTDKIEINNSEESSSSQLPYAKLFEIAAGGTLFIQEIDRISPATQIELAQTIKAQPYPCFVIGSIQIEPRVREEGLLPELHKCFTHLHYIIPLRERKRDIPILVQGILEKLAQKNHRKTPVVTAEATQLLLSHHYRQGNVTELIQVLERSFFLASQDTIGLEQIFFGPTSEKVGQKVNLLRWSPIEQILKDGNFLRVIRQIAAVLFLFLIGGLIFASHLPGMLKAFALVWGLWWPVITLISPSLGRIWCAVCPFSTIMDFVQNKFHPHRPVPDFIVKYDYLIVTVLFLAIFWIEIVTQMHTNPLFTGLLLLVMQLAAIVVSVLYPRHAWCRHFCPLGGFIGTASIGSLLEVRSDPAVCLNKCTTFECYVGKGEVKGCPMSQHLPYLDNNLDCKLCFNCVQNCPHGSVQVNLRVPAREVWNLTRVNQGYAVFMGVLLGILFPINYLEPLQPSGLLSQLHISFSMAYFSFAVLGGALGWWFARPFKTKAASLRTKLVFALTPLVIAGHIIYQLNFVPGLQSLVLGAGYQGPGGFRSFFISASAAAKGSALVIGIFLASITIIFVLLKRRKK